MKDSVNREFEFVTMKHEDNLGVWSQEIKIVFILRGKGWLHMEEATNAYEISQEDIFVINSFQMHSILLEENALAIALLLSPSFIATFSPETSNVNINCKSFLYSEDKQQIFDVLRRDFALAFRAWYKNEFELSIHLRSKIIILMDNLFRNFSKNKMESGKESGRERLRVAVDYIQRNYRESITLTDLSSHTHLSSPYISRSFRKYLGISFTEYLTQVRLFHVTALLRSERTITEIAYESGFSSSSAMIDAFKQYNGITPGQYRRSMGEVKCSHHQPDIHEEEGFYTSFTPLMKYAEQVEEKVMLPAVAICEISVNIGSVRCHLNHNWKMMINAGYGRDILNSSIQNQILKLQKTVRFRYIRCKGILDDDMMLYTCDVYGNVSVNYVYLDRLLDFILSTGAKPLLELGHMPSIMAKNRVQTFKRPVFLSSPKDMEQWNILISGLMEHMAKRYGIEEMKRWLFAPWISVDLHLFGFFTLEDYADIYSTSYRAIKNISNDFKVCGPGCSSTSPQTREWFFDMCKKQGCMPDIFTVRSFATIDPNEEESGMKLVESNEAFYMAVSGDEDYLTHYFKEIHSFMEHKGMGNIPIMLDEWSNNIWQRDLCNDTSYKSAYIFKNIMENHDSYYGMGYYNLGDQLDEIAPAAEIFHGGFGLFTQNGIPKSAYRAMQLLNKAGDKLIAKGDGYFITSSEDEVQIFLHNYCHYDMLYRYRNTTNLSRTERYRVFNEKQQKSYHIHMEGFKPGKHILRRYGIGPSGGSTYDAWLEMGAPEPMTKEEEKRLYQLSYPRYRVESLEAEGYLKIKAWLLPHEVQLITISI